jgi:hypothetical protein
LEVRISDYQAVNMKIRDFLDMTPCTLGIKIWLFLRKLGFRLKGVSSEETVLSSPGHVFAFLYLWIHLAWVPTAVASKTVIISNKVL